MVEMPDDLIPTSFFLDVIILFCILVLIIRIIFSYHFKFFLWSLFKPRIRYIEKENALYLEPQTYAKFQALYLTYLSVSKVQITIDEFLEEIMTFWEVLFEDFDKQWSKKQNEK